MGEVVNITDGGLTKFRGRTVGVINLHVSTREAAPEIIMMHCITDCQEDLIRAIKRFCWIKEKKPQKVIPAEAGIQDDLKLNARN